jgi:hypothetical protein
VAQLLDRSQLVRQCIPNSPRIRVQQRSVAVSQTQVTYNAVDQIIRYGLLRAPASRYLLGRTCLAALWYGLLPLAKPPPWHAFV